MSIVASCRRTVKSLRHPLTRRTPDAHPFGEGLLSQAETLAALALAAECAVAAGKASPLPTIHGRGLSDAERHAVHAARNAAEAIAADWAADYPGDLATVLDAGEKAAIAALRRVLATRPVVCRWTAKTPIATPRRFEPSDEDAQWWAENAPSAVAFTALHPAPRGTGRDTAEEMGSIRGMDDDETNSAFRDYERAGEIVARFGRRR